MALLLGRWLMRREWAAGVLCLATPQLAWGDDQKPEASTPQRPAIMFNRFQENWSVLADPRVPREPFDELKYIPLSSVDPYTYLSFGANTRERFEFNNAANFGTGPNRSQNYVISRNEFHADLRVDNQIQAFVQFQADYAPWKTMLTPVDRDKLDLEQGWVALTESVGGGTLKLRGGRQQFAFDLQRFVSVRDGPNVRQSYDAAWADYENGPWRFITFYSLPVQVRDVTIFDDYSSVSAQTFGMVRTEYKFSELLFIAGYYANFTQGNAQFPNASGNERRDIVDIHLNGNANHFDFDFEVMNQTGRIGNEPIEAWAVGSLAGYTFADVKWSPRVGIQFDAASGDGNNKQTFGTFNPLFPNGYYFTLAGYTGYTNLIHIKPSLTLSSEFVAEDHGRGSGPVAAEHGGCNLHSARHCGPEHCRPARRLYRKLCPASARLDDRSRNCLRSRGGALCDR